MAQSNGKRARVERRAVSKVPAVLREGFIETLKAAKAKQKRYSQARAARSMGVDVSTVERYVSGKTDVNAGNVLASKRLWRHFWLCVGKLMHKVHGDKRTPPRLARRR